MEDTNNQVEDSTSASSVRKDSLESDQNNKIECSIIQSNNITIPSIVIENRQLDQSEYDLNDIKTIFKIFGKVDDFIIKDKILIILFQNFIDCEVCYEFLTSQEKMKNIFKITFFNFEKDRIYLNDEQLAKYEQIHLKNSGFLKKPFQIPLKNNQTTPLHIYPPTQIPGSLPMQNNYNYFLFQNYQNVVNNNIKSMVPGLSPVCIPPPNYTMLYPPFLNNYKVMQNYKFIEEKNYGKFTCKYEILIDNDKEFQVARRLIGSKGYNMKRIIQECKTSENPNENVKLRLRGRGSGYKEGPQNKESDEPLHLCISAKNQEELRKACGYVDELLDKIFQEYKKYCVKNNIECKINAIANKIDGGNSLQKMFSAPLPELSLGIPKFKDIEMEN
jgi:hypothetical protein